MSTNSDYDSYDDADEVDAFVPNNDFQKNLLSKVNTGHMSVRAAATLLGTSPEAIQMAVWGEIRQ